MIRPLASLLLSCALLCAPVSDVAAAPDQSSGGYSRPNISSYSRPSVAPSYAPSSRAGSSGGYATPTRRPSTSYSSSYATGGDSAISRQFSGEALRNYQANQGASRSAPRYGGSNTRRPSTSNDGGYVRPWAPVYAPPSYGWAQQGRSFGAWDGLMLWSLLNSLSSPGHAEFFYNNQNSPAYQQWRAEAQRAAATDPTVRTRLAELDQRLAQSQGQPQQPSTPPPADARSSGGLTFITVLFLLIAVFVALWYLRRKRANPAASAPAAPAALKGTARTRFRVGMTIPIDPAPFILAAGVTKIEPLSGTGMISVEAVGVSMDGAIPLNRLYLPGRTAFFQLHLGPDGNPDECRYYSRIDRVTPASQDEWGAWLDPTQGMIGWPQFQTKDGKIYDRVWAPGSERIEPRRTEETIQDLNGISRRQLISMLYAGPTGARSPAPEREYIFVTAVDEGGQAWVDIHAGIDINPATLNVPSVALS